LRYAPFFYLYFFSNNNHLFVFSNTVAQRLLQNHIEKAKGTMHPNIKIKWFRFFLEFNPNKIFEKF